MRTLIIIQEADFPWFCRQSPGDDQPLMTKINNKPFLEYLLDFAVLAGSRAIRICMADPDPEIEQYFSPGLFRGASLSYSNIFANDSVSQIISKNMPFCRASSLMLILPGYFIHYDKDMDFTHMGFAEPDGVELTCANGSILYCPDDDIRPMVARVSSNFKLNLTPISNPGDFINLANTISSQKQYMPPAEIEGQSRPMAKNGACILTHLLLALILILVQLIPFIFLSIYLTFRGRLKFQSHRYYIDNKRSVVLPWITVGTDMGSRIYKKISLERLPLLFHVFTGKLAIIGTRLLRDNSRNSALLRDFNNYQPGVFTYSEAMGIHGPGEEQEITDRYFADQPCTLNADIVKLLKALINRLKQ